MFVSEDLLGHFGTGQNPADLETSLAHHFQLIYFSSTEFCLDARIQSITPLMLNGRLGSDLTASFQILRSAQMYAPWGSRKLVYSCSFRLGEEESNFPHI